MRSVHQLVQINLRFSIQVVSGKNVGFFFDKNVRQNLIDKKLVVPFRKHIVQRIERILP